MDGIIVGVDEPAAGLAAARWALDEGVLHSRPVTAVRAWVEPPTVGSGVGGRHPARIAVLSSLRESAEDCARELLRQAGGRTDGPAATAIAIQGRPEDVLCFASRGADLVVVGARSADALAPGVLGPVSTCLLQHAYCPVVVVPTPDSVEATDEHLVVVGVDYSLGAHAALQRAAHEAALRSWQLVPVLVRGPEVLRSSDAAGDVLRQEPYVRAALTAAAQRLVPDLHVEPEIMIGHAADALLDFTGAGDLLVVGSRSRGRHFRALLGSTSTTIAARARCPVVVVRPPRQPTATTRGGPDTSAGVASSPNSGPPARTARDGEFCHGRKSPSLVPCRD